MSTASQSDYTWGSVVNSKGRIGYRVYNVSETNTTYSCTVAFCFWSRGSVSESTNSYTYAVGSTSGSGSNVSFSHSDSSAAWSTSLHRTVYKTVTKSFTKTTSKQTIKISSTLTGVNYVGSSMSVSASAGISIDAGVFSRTATFNGNGGTVSTSTITKTTGTALGTLPTATRSGYSFTGWYTSASGGTKISSSKLMPSTNVTYYAHWALVDLLEMTITPRTITIPSTTAGVANLSTVYLPFKLVTTSANASSSYYYKVCNVKDEEGYYASNECGSTYGPYTKSSTDSNASKIPVDPSLIYKSIRNTRNKSKVKLVVLCRTGTGSFDDSDVTVGYLVSCPLSNFQITTIDLIKCYRSSGNIYAKIKITFPKSYTVSTSIKNPTIKVAGTTVTPSSISKSVSSNTITYEITISGNAGSKKLSFEFDDGIFDASLVTHINSTGNENILIYKSDNSCKCTEFVESDSIQFQKGGRMFAVEFNEVDGDVEQFEKNGTVNYSELIEG